MMRKKHSFMSESKGPVRIGDLMPQLMARYGFQRQLGSEEIIAAWNLALEPYLTESIRKSTCPGSLKRGVLEVRVEHSAVIQELTFLEQDILAKLKESLPNAKVNKIKYVY